MLAQFLTCKDRAVSIENKSVNLACACEDNLVDVVNFKKKSQLYFKSPDEKAQYTYLCKTAFISKYPQFSDQ